MKAPAGARLMIGFDGHDVTPEFQDVLGETGARGVVLFARNLRSVEQVTDLIAELRGLVPWPLIVAVDQEGGGVVRMAEGLTVFPGNLALGLSDSVDLALQQGYESGRQLGALGFDLNLAPVVDLLTRPDNPIVGLRSLGQDLERVALLARGLVYGHARAGVACCLKHFPGLGDAHIDPHEDVPVLDTRRDVMLGSHVAVFRKVLGDVERLSFMTTHVLCPSLDDELATFSRPLAHDLIRDHVGFHGLVLTDDLEMGAIARWGDVAAAAVRAAAAGHDMVLVCHRAERQRAAAESLRQALERGALDPAEHVQALKRIEAFARWSGAEGPVDTEDGDRVAREIARAALHLFNDPRGLVPFAAGSTFAVLAPDFDEVTGEGECLEPGADGAGFAAALSNRGMTSAGVVTYDPGAPPAEAEAVLARLGDADRVVLLGHDAARHPFVAELISAAASRFDDRLVVVHVRNPFDQQMVPPTVTSLTTAGARKVQLQALADALAGEVPFVHPRPLRR